jgi:hypothetical protein
MDDMSSDETETEGTNMSRKVVRRIRKAWISPEVSQTWHAVDRAYKTRRPDGLLKRGNRPLERALESTTSNSHAQPKPHLPVNFYEGGISSAKLATLKPLTALGLNQVCFVL